MRYEMARSGQMGPRLTATKDACQSHVLCLAVTVGFHLMGNAETIMTSDEPSCLESRRLVQLNQNGKGLVTQGLQSDLRNRQPCNYVDAMLILFVWVGFVENRYQEDVLKAIVGLAYANEMLKPTSLQIALVIWHFTQDILGAAGSPLRVRTGLKLQLGGNIRRLFEGFHL